MSVNQNPLSKKQLAEHRGISPSVLSKPKYKGMPQFFDFEDFDRWYESGLARNARSVREIPRESDKNFFNPPRSGYEIDTDEFIRPGDYDELTIDDAEKAVQIAYGLLNRAFKNGDAARIGPALKNWSEAARQSAALREAYLEILKERNRLVDLDIAFNLFGPVLSEVRNFLARLGAVCCNAANPEMPETAKLAIEAQTDRFLERIAGTEESARRTIEENETSA